MERVSVMSQNPNDQQLLQSLQKNLELLVGRIEFGRVELLFHQGKLVQVEKTEKLRVEPAR